MANEPTQSPVPSTTAPLRHVRTFAQDVARLSGKSAPIAPAPTPRPTSAPKPDTQTSPEKEIPVAPVAPLPPPPEPPPARIIPKAPTTDETREAVLARLRQRQAPQEKPVVPVAIPKAPSTNETKEDVLARLRAKAQATAQESAIKLPEREAVRVPAPPAPEPFAPAPKKIEPLSVPLQGPERIHTYKTDFAGHAQEQSASNLSVLAAEADSNRPARVIFKEKKRFPFALIAGLLLFATGAGGIYVAYQTVSNTPVVFFTPRVPSLVAYDERTEVRADHALEDFVGAISEPLLSGNIRVVYTAAATTSETGEVLHLPTYGDTLIRALSLPMPDILARSIKKESTVGVISEETPSAFFILRVDSFERSFAGMLEWETHIAQDLARIYPPYPEEIQEVSSTTPPVETTIQNSLSSGFKDELAQNKDIRVLRDEKERIILLYGFRDKETLIITRDIPSYLSLVERLNSLQGE